MKIKIIKSIDIYFETLRCGLLKCLLLSNPSNLNITFVYTDTYTQKPIIITTTLLNIIVFFRYAQVRGAKFWLRHYYKFMTYYILIKQPFFKRIKLGFATPSLMPYDRALFQPYKGRLNILILPLRKNFRTFGV